MSIEEKQAKNKSGEIVDLRLGNSGDWQFHIFEWSESERDRVSLCGTETERTPLVWFSSETMERGRETWCPRCMSLSLDRVERRIWKKEDDEGFVPADLDEKTEDTNMARGVGQNEILDYLAEHYDETLTVTHMARQWPEKADAVGEQELANRIGSTMGRLMEKERYGIERLSRGVYRRSRALEDQQNAEVVLGGTPDPIDATWETLAIIGDDVSMVRSDEGEVRVAVSLSHPCAAEALRG